MEPARLWIPGILPVQFLILLAVLFFVGIAVQRVLTRTGWRITMFWQVVLAWIACWGFLTFMLQWPLPFHLRANYLGVITLALFLYAGATESGWQECRDTVLSMLRGRTRVHRLARIAVFVGLPLATYAGLHDQMIPRFEVPLAFRAYHPPPPRTFTVHGVNYFNGFSGETWIGNEDADPSPAQHDASVTVHLPPHLVDLARGYTEVQIVAPVRDLYEAMSRVESTLPRLRGQLYRPPWDDGPEPYVNYFIVDKDGRFVGGDGYAVGGRFKCCTANRWTATPLGSDIYILPKGYAFNDEPVDPGVPMRSSPSARRGPLADINLRTSL